MRRQRLRAALLVVSATAATAAGIGGGASTSAASTSSSDADYVASCAVATPGHMACNALRSLRARLQRPSAVSSFASAAALPSGYGPADLQSAYNLASAAAANGGTQTVALVDAYDDPNAESDLAVYRSTYGLPPCTSASGCFAKVPGNGGATLPAANGGWAQEESLDIDMVSAICPNCKIRLVEAASNLTTSLEKAEQTAAALGATEISNSYGGSESSADVQNAKTYYTYPGVYVTASNGDAGYGVEFPAAAPSVVAVGGTALNHASNARGWSETVWGSSTPRLTGGTGSGCSKYEKKQTWQKDTGCGKRTVGDVAAVADPNTGVAVYDSTPYLGSSGWMVFGGTSVASPIIASVAALAGNAAAYPQIAPAAYLYYQKAQLFDVTSGTDGNCSGSYLCTGKVGYDGPTGWGTPNGIGAF